jgi:outer membrane protein assembly factor BamB/TolA-binding protein
MITELLLQLLEQLGSIDPRVLRKVRTQVEDQTKPVKPDVILKYLVSKGYLDEQQAGTLLQQATVLAEQQSAGGSAAPVAPDPSKKPVDDFEDQMMSTFLESASPSQPAESPKPAEVTPQPPGGGSSAEKLPTESTPPASAQPAPTAAPSKKSGSKPKPSAKPSGGKKAPVAFDPHAETVLDPDFDPRDLAGVTPVELVDEPVYSGLTGAGYGDYGSAMEAPRGSQLPTFRGKRDKRNQWATKWLFIGFTVLGLLLVLGAVLAIATLGVSADERYKLAVESLDSGAYLDAAKRFEEFVQMHPRHKNVPQAKANYAQSLIRAEYQAGSFEQAIVRADELLPPLIDDPLGRIDDLRDDLALLLPRSLSQITDAATRLTDVEAMNGELERSLRLLQIVDKNEYIPTSYRRKPTTADYLSKIDNDIRILRSQIEKENEYSKTLVEIRDLGEQAKTNDAFSIYRRLVRNYGDLAGREELRAAMLAISEKEQELVVPISVDLTTSGQFRPTAVRQTFILARTEGEAIESLNDEVVSFLADGAVYSLRAGDGQILWRQFVGYQTTIQPEVIGPNMLLVADQGEQDLMLLEQESGSLVWRLEINEPFLVPVVNDLMIVVTTESGKVLKVQRDSGQVMAAVQLPQAANVSAMLADREPFIYQVGLHSSLYVLSIEDLSCREVIYLGHERGSVASPATYWSGYVLIAVNRGGHCDLWVYRPQENGLKLELAQVINRITDSFVSSPIQRYSRWVMLSGDQGDIRILELKTGEEINPVTRFASDRFENSGARTFLLTEGNSIWIAGGDLSRVKFQRTQATFNRELLANSGDLFLAPLKKLDDYIFHVRRRKESGMLSAALVDGMTLRPVWRTDFSGIVSTPGSGPSGPNQQLRVVSHQGDFFQLAPGSSERVIGPTAISSPIVETLKFPHVLATSAGLAAMGVPGQSEMLFVKGDRSSLHPLEQPANQPACPPLVFGDHLIVPSSNGPVARVNPERGRIVGTPFLPPVAANETTQWLEPTQLNETQIAVARGSDRSGQNLLYRLGLANPQAIEELEVLESRYPFKSRLINNGQQLFAVVTAEGTDVLQGIGFRNQFAVDYETELGGRVVEGPWLAGTGVLVRMDNDQLLWFDANLVQGWSLSIPATSLAGQPTLHDGGLLIGFQDGLLMIIDPQSGQLRQELRLRQPIAGSLQEFQQRWYVAGRDGTVHEIELSGAGGVN